jgi:hypothetical protein
MTTWSQGANNKKEMYSGSTGMQPTGISSMGLKNRNHSPTYCFGWSVQQFILILEDDKTRLGDSGNMKTAGLSIQVLGTTGTVSHYVTSCDMRAFGLNLGSSPGSVSYK